MKLHLLIVLLLLGRCYALKAQDERRKDSIDFDLHLSATVILSGGNLERTVTQNRLWGSVGNNKLEFVTENSYRYGRNFNRVVENDLLSRNYIRFFPHHKLYGFVLAVYEDNFRRSIENRRQYGAGGAYNFFKNKKDFLRANITLAYEEAVYKIDSFNIAGFNGSKSITETRGIIRFGGHHTILQNHLVLRHDTWWMQGLRNSGNYRWHSLIGMQVPVYKGLAFRTEFDYTYESVTISNKNPFGFPSSKKDWVLSFGLSYDMTGRK
jgi:Protein of unknown function, DUF481